MMNLGVAGLYLPWSFRRASKSPPGIGFGLREVTLLGLHAGLRHHQDIGAVLDLGSRAAGWARSSAS